MRGSEVYTNLQTPTIVGVLPANEAQVRPLTQLETPGKQQAAWKAVLEAVGDGKITAKDVSLQGERIQRVKKARSILSMAMHSGTA